ARLRRAMPRALLPKVTRRRAVKSSLMLALTRWLVISTVAGLMLASCPLHASSLNEAIQPERVTLDNGLEVWLKSRPGSGSISLIAGVKLGRRYETLHQRGLVHFVEHMVFQGTSKRSRKGLDQDVRARGGDSWGRAGDDLTWIGLELPAGELEFGLKWLAEVLFDSTFPPDRVEVTRKVVIRERTPRELGTLWWRLTREVFGENSLVQGPKDHKSELRNLRRVSRDELVRLYGEQYVPNNVVLAVVGDFEPERALGLVRDVFGHIPRGPDPPAGARSAPAVRDRRASVAAFGNYKSSHVWCGYAVPSCAVDDLSRLHWMFWLMSIRAKDRIREEEGWSYAIGYYPGHATFHGSAEAQPFLLMADCRHSDIGRVQRIMRQELARIRSESLSPRDIEMMRAAAASGWREFVESNRQLASVYVGWAVYQGSPPDVEAMTDALTSAGILHTAQVYLRPQRRLAAYHRPYKTPRQLIVMAAVIVAVLGVLVVLGRRTNARLAPRTEHIEETLGSRNTPRFVCARVLRALIYDGAAILVFVWLPWKLSEYLFTRAMFGAEIAVWLAYMGGFFTVIVALSFTAIARRVVVSSDGLLIVTAGFHIILRPERMRSVEVGTLGMWRFAFDPRVFVLGGDTGRWVLVRGPLRTRWYLAVKDPEQFARDAAALLSRGAVIPRAESAPAAGGSE
ncbi:MAG: insulinase family protein, partial [Armatimonadota bacterium]